MPNSSLAPMTPKTISITCASAALLAALLLHGTPTRGQNLINNGDFESGDLTGWTASTTTFSPQSGDLNYGFAAQSTGSGVIPGFPPAFGTFAAYSSTLIGSNSIGTAEYVNYLKQDFTVPTATVSSALLTWEQAAAWDGSGTFRGVDLLAALYNGSTFLDNHYSLSNPGSSGSFAWTSQSWDVTSFLQANPGATLTLELVSLAFIDTRSPIANSYSTELNSGWDNIALNVVTVPEPSGISMMSVGLGLLYALRRLKRPQTGIH